MSPASRGSFTLVRPPEVGPANSKNTGFQNAPGYPGGPTDIAGVNLTDGSNTTVVSNTTYKYYKNLGQFNSFFYGAIGVSATPVHNVTLIGCLWENSGSNSVGVVPCADGPITLSYCTVRPTGLTAPPVPQATGYQYGIVCDGTQASPGTFNSYGQQLTINNCDIWGFANGTKIAGSTQTWPLAYSYCWFHDLRINTNGLDHQDGPGIPGGGITSSYITIDHCTINAPGDTNGLAFQTGSTPWDHFWIRYNWFGGFGNFVNLGTGAGTCTNVIFTDNTFTTQLQCLDTPLYNEAFATSTGSLWRRNRWHVPVNAYWGHMKYDGYYWLPVSGATVDPTTDELTYGLVSTTDFAG